MQTLSKKDKAIAAVIAAIIAGICAGLASLFGIGHNLTPDSVVKIEQTTIPSK